MEIPGMPNGLNADVPTVTGNVAARDLGVTLMHEHVIHRISNYSHRSDNTCVDVDLAAQELRIFRDRGGGTVCDVTPIGVGRDPSALREVSERSGVHIVTAVGLYDPCTYPDEVRGASREQIADFLVREAQRDDVGIPAGFLGEVYSHNEEHSDWRRYRLTEEETRVFRAFADAHRRTGLFISTHASIGRHGVAQLRVLVEAGADPQRVIIGHCDAQAHDDIEIDLEYCRLLLAEGACLEFDMFGWEELLPDALRFERVAALVREGYTDRLFLSMDTCRLSQLHRFNGRGFDYLFTHVLPGLRAAGVSEQAIQQMTVVNPARILCRN
jgi:phosphotriesterase-related protein